MIRRLSIFATATVLLALLLLGPTWALAGPRPSQNLLIAAALCGLPAFVSLVMVELVGDRGPESQAAVMALGTGIRMVTVLAGAAILVKVFPQLVGSGDLAFWGWVIVFYLFTLAWEVAIVAARRPPENPPPGA